MDTGDAAWVLGSAALVLFMTPGLAFFYGGMDRARNVLNMLMMNFWCLLIIPIVWVVVGYSLAQAPFENDFIGGFDNAFLADIADYDALRTGMRREAMYYGTQNLIEGTVEALHAAILAGLLIVGGTSENPLGLRLMGVVAGLSILAGYLAFRGYRLPDTVTAETVSLDGTRRTAPAITAGPS